MNKKQKKMLTRIIIAAVMIIALNLIQVTGIVQLLLYLATYLIIGYDILKKAGKGIINRQVFDENFLMAVATVGAFALAIYSGSGDYNEAIAVMLFYQIGELFQSYAVGKSRKNISALMDIRPDYANVERNGKLEKVDPDEVGIESIIVVQPGEKVPLDGIVIEGSSSLNTSALTGESLPRDVKQGDEIISGCINMTGVLKIQTTKEFGESTVSKILELVENSSSRKSKSENFISKFARVYTPAVCYGALALALLPPLVQMLFLGQTAQWGVWIYRALTFLVISCPCALVISIPLSFFAGIGGASKEGVLIKGSNYMETLSQAKYEVVDSGKLSGTHGDTAKTFYIGSKNSSIYFCLYEKEKEQKSKGIKTDIKNRFEIRLKNEKAGQTIEQLVFSRNPEQTIASLILTQIDFPDYILWDIFLDNVTTSLPFIMTPVAVNMDKTKRWLERQVMPSLLMIKEIEKKTGANYLEEIDRHTRLTEKQELKIKQMTTDIADMIENDTAVPQGSDGIF